PDRRNNRVPSPAARGSGFQRNKPFVPTLMLQCDLDIPLFHEPRKLFSPLDEQNAFRIHQVVERQRVQFALGINAVEIDVIHRQVRPAVLVDQRERRAGNGGSGRGLEAFRGGLHQRGFSCTPPAAPQNNAGRVDLGGAVSGGFPGVLRRGGGGRP